MVKGGNSLNLESQLKLADWFSINLEWFHKERPSYMAAAEKAEKDLGFRITWSNVKSVNEARGKLYIPRGGCRSGEKRESLKQLIREQAAEVLSGVEKRIADIEEVVLRLCRDLGTQPVIPAKTTDLSNKRVATACQR